MTIAHVRRQYLGAPLSDTESDPDPVRQFSIWFDQIREIEPDPTAMALATATRDGRPSARTVLLKKMDARGFVFYTSYASRKAREMAESGRASLLFFWRAVDRQVRIDGTVEKVSDAESDAYFTTRPLESRWAAAASPQSEPLESREALESQYAAVRDRFGEAVRRPESWGGYRVVPDEIEFWQGRENRLHDRLLYTKQSDGTWRRQRLAP